MKPATSWSFSVMAKPAAAACNLACHYCYYRARPGMPASRRMSGEVLEAYIRDSIAAQPEAGMLTFSWQGGEPTLAGLGFFREAVALQERYRPPGMEILNALQTNGTLIDGEWAAFFREHAFLIGLSLDGPARFHDPLRRDGRGRGSHAAAVRALELLARGGVELNTLTVLHRLNYRHGREVYRFLRRLGARHMQFIPLVERRRGDGELAGPPADDRSPEVAPWTAPREGFGEFLCDVFDDWLANDVGRVFVQLFEEHVGVLAGRPARLCVFAPDCRGTPMLEASGELYSCDHYGYAPYRLGNILAAPIGELARSPAQARFGAAKRAALPAACRRCALVGACWGGCPKHRFVAPAEGSEPENYLCPSYRRFFSHTAPALRRIARMVQAVD
jgi:uncharacterized protein